MIFSIFIDGTSLSLDVSGSIEYKIMILKKEQEEEEEGNISPHSLGGGQLPAQLPVTRARRPPSPSGAWRAVTSATWPAAASSAATSCLMPRDWWWDGQRISVHMWSSVCLDYIETRRSSQNMIWTRIYNSHASQPCLTLRRTCEQLHVKSRRHVRTCSVSTSHAPGYYNRSWCKTSIS